MTSQVSAHKYLEAESLTIPTKHQRLFVSLSRSFKGNKSSEPYPVHT